MPDSFVGHLPASDPLHGYLCHDILPQLGVPPGGPAKFRVFRMHATNQVYLYEEKHSGARVVGKFLNHAHGGAQPGVALGAQEFQNLRGLRALGLDASPHTVVRPLGHNSAIDHVLVVEFAPGEPLSAVINAALFHGRSKRLYRKLGALASYLAAQHNRTADGATVDFDQDGAYFARLLGQLERRGALDRRGRGEFEKLLARWRGVPDVWQDRQVWVHGDATPANFLFGRGADVTAIDLERAKRADRVFDVGRIAGELKHHFLQATGDRFAAEPYIGHFLWEYCGHFPDRAAAFRSVTRRVPLHMGATLLRVARNDWVGERHRRRLIAEARQCLRGV